MFLEDAATKFLRQNKVSAATRYTYKSVLNRLVDYLGPDRSVSSITYYDFLEYLKSVSGRVSGATADNYTKTVRQFAYWMVSQKRIKTTPAIQPPRFIHEKPDPQIALTDDEVKRLLEAAQRNTRNFTILSILAKCGLTAEAVSKLQLQDFDEYGLWAWEHGIRRCMPLGEVRPIVEQWVITHPGKPTDPIFYAPSSGKPLTPRAVRYIVSNAGERAKLDRKISIEGFYHRRALQLKMALDVIKNRSEKSFGGNFSYR